MKGLYKDDSTNRNELMKWEREALENFEAKMTDKEKPFPCIPATIGFTLNHLRYGFIGNPEEASTIYELAELLKEFSTSSKEFGKYTSLIVFYKIPHHIKNNYSIEQFEQLFWQQLNRLSAIDKVDWPNDIPTNPNNSIWEFCFHGGKFFMYCATPVHENRESRHFDTMMLAITPRWVLKEFNKSETYAKNIKTQVRKRLSKYDATSIHPDLNSYGVENNFEWKQYFLRDDDTSLSKCPFHHLHISQKSNK
ncbi:YqcI/YcgG family protein [Metabacillus fastidiosus]